MQITTYRRLDIKNGRVDLSMGAGGRAMTQLITEMFQSAFNNKWLLRGNDQAVFDVTTSRLMMTTDSYVISPLFFPGGNIGSLAVHGTINDLAVGGGKPLHLAASFIIEEGLLLSQLKEIVLSMAKAATEAGVSIITGDTKVVERGKGDGIFITTTGIGTAQKEVELDVSRIKPGDCIILSGSIGDHGIAVLSQRHGLKLADSLVSDSASLHTLTAKMLEVGGNSIRVMRDPTRGGLAATLNEFAAQAQIGFHLEETAIPIKTPVAAACEVFGLDPLYIANEGKLVAIVGVDAFEAVLSAMRVHPLGYEAALIGHAVEDENGFVEMTTRFGGTRMVDWLAGEQLPRIC